MEKETPRMGTAEKPARAVSGFFGIPLVLFLAVLAVGSIGASNRLDDAPQQSLFLVTGGVCGLGAFFLLRGFLTLQPNESAVLTFFGRYSGTLTRDGFWLVNPFSVRRRVSRRLVSQEIGPLKVNDEAGNPVEIGMVLTWRVAEASRAVFDVESYPVYVSAQGETALRSLANSHPYDEEEYRQALSVRQGADTRIAQDMLSLRDGGDRLTAALLADLRDRMGLAGLIVADARLSHLAYSPEIAGAMLRKQAASAVIAARRTITSGAVDIVEQALTELEGRLGSVLDADRKAAMVSNLLVVLVGDREVAPVINTGVRQP